VRITKLLRRRCSPAAPRDRRSPSEVRRPRVSSHPAPVSPPPPRTAFHSPIVARPGRRFRGFSRGIDFKPARLEVFGHAEAAPLPCEASRCAALARRWSRRCLRRPNRGDYQRASPPSSRCVPARGLTASPPHPEKRRTRPSALGTQILAVGLPALRCCGADSYARLWTDHARGRRTCALAKKKKKEPICM